MKKVIIFESAVVGLLVGVVASTYLVYLNSTNGFIGKALSSISLGSVLEKILGSGATDSLFVSFIFYVAVYTLYGAIAGIMIAIVGKARPVVFIALGALAIIGIEQGIGSYSYNPVPEPVMQTASVLKATERKPKQPERYFGMEAYGDLNGDSKDDVAFIINRNDPDRGMLYYIAAALADEQGKTGTNLIFLGDKIAPASLSIASGTIQIDYTKIGSKATTTGSRSAHIMNGVLEKQDIASTTSAS